MNVRITPAALSMLLAPALISACAQTQLVPQNTTQPDAGALRAVPVCAGSRIGQAQCDVLVDIGSVGPMAWHGWTASDIEEAYNLPSSSKGDGQTVAVVDAFDNPIVAKDLAFYRSAMGLPKAKFAKYNEEGLQHNYPKGSPDWGVEIALDVEMVSASCPNCTIDLVEANSNAWSSLEAAVREAVKLGATTISNSYGGTGANCSAYDAKRVTYLASAGDQGLGISKPASCDDVVAVGGTVLELAPRTKRGFKETLWGDSGGACSTEPKPAWQHDDKCTNRFADDVSAVAVNVAIYDTYGGASGWIKASGTSISSPFLAGVFGLAENSKQQEGGKTFWDPEHDKYLYQLTVPRYSAQGGWGSPEGVGAF